MNRGWYWRLGTVLFVVVAAFVVLWPSIPRLSTPWVRSHIPFRLNEGLDIRGGARLSYDVQIGQAIADRRVRAMEDFRAQLAGDFGIHHGEGRLTPDEITRLAERVSVVVGGTNREFVARFRNAADAGRVTDRLVSNRGLRRLGTSGTSITLGFPGWLNASLALAMAVIGFTSDNLTTTLRDWRKGDHAAALLFLPNWTSYMLIIVIASSTASIIGVSELVSRCNTVINATGNTRLMLPVYLYACACFFLFCYPLTRLMQWSRAYLSVRLGPAPH